MCNRFHHVLLVDMGRSFRQALCVGVSNNNNRASYYYFLTRVIDPINFHGSIQYKYRVSERGENIKRYFLHNNRVVLIKLLPYSLFIVAT